MTLTPEPAPPEAPAASARRRLGALIYRGVGWTAVGLATAGVFLPILPTTPFLLVAAWAFAKSSPALAERLRNHPRFGAFLRDWQERGAIPVKAKVTAIALMTASFGIVALTTRNAWVLAGVGATLSAVAVYLVSRPNA